MLSCNTYIANLSLSYIYIYICSKQAFVIEMFWSIKSIKLVIDFFWQDGYWEKTVASWLHSFELCMMLEETSLDVFLFARTHQNVKQFILKMFFFLVFFVIYLQLIQTHLRWWKTIVFLLITVSEYKVKLNVKHLL